MRHSTIKRRQMLRGAAGAVISLPLLDSLQGPARANESESVPKRFVAINAGLGFHTPYLFPQSPGPLKPETPYLKQVKNHLDKLTLLSGLSHPEQQGNSGHASERTILTSAQRPGLAGFRNTISLDQVIAQQIGHKTRYPYLALSTRSGSSLSWTANGVAIPGESSPSRLFKALFLEGSEKEIAADLAAVKRGRSILDTVGGRARQLKAEISLQDGHKLEEYLASVRELEIRLQQSEGWIKRPKPQVDAEPPEDIDDHTRAIGRQRLLYDIIVFALRTDSTRTVTFELSGLNSVPDVPGVSSDWHGLSHHGKDPSKIEELKLIEQAEFAVFNEFLDKLRAIEEGNGTLLDHTAILYSSNLGNASAHDWRNLPIVVAGGGYRHGQYTAHDAGNNTPLANLFVSFAQRMGVETDTFGSSTAAGVRGLES